MEQNNRGNQNENANEQDAATAGESEQDRQNARTGPTEKVNAKNIHADETDGAGTGGMGADMGGYGPVPGSQTSG